MKISSIATSGAGEETSTIVGFLEALSILVPIRDRFWTHCHLPSVGNAGAGFVRNFDCGGSTGYGSSVTADYECNPIQSPIIKDGGAKAIPLTDVEHGVVYDVLGNGSAHLASWPVPGTEDSFLVRDINKNGLIDSFKEMFGNSTEQVASYNPNGFRALAMLDSNVDGQVTAQDSKYGELQWWTDRNHDGISQSGELSRVTESLSTTYKLSRKIDEYGNQFRYRAKVGYNSWMWDVFLVLRPYC